MEEAVDGEEGHTVVEGIIGMGVTMEDMEEEGVIMEAMEAVTEGWEEVVMEEWEVGGMEAEGWAEEATVEAVIINHIRIIFDIFTDNVYVSKLFSRFLHLMRNPYGRRSNELP